MEESRAFVEQPSDDHGESDSETTTDNRPRYLCMKYNRSQEGDRVSCQDPGLYCKYRPSCLIHYQEKRRRRKASSEDSGD